jgi:UDP-N-acetylmuramoyl-L-alanyl-D-glutamate--2,6-diaminopimelate ligase
LILSRILEDVTVDSIAGPADPTVLGLAYDSRKVEEGYLFAAIAGEVRDGSQFIPEAVRRGACAILSSRPAPDPPPVTWVRVPDDREALAIAARNYYSRPDERTGVIGVTGTNGKTTVVHLVESILKAAGEKVCALGTLAYRIGSEEMRAERTTPEAVDLCRLLDRAASEGCRHAVMEVSSHSLALKRVAGLRFAAAVFTNLTRDHLDFHGDMEHYREAKSILFRGLPEGHPAVVNADDPASSHFLSLTRGRPVTYGFGEGADVRIASFQPDWKGIEMTLRVAGAILPLKSRLFGRPNASNIAAAVAVSTALGAQPEHAAAGVAALAGVPGRLESVEAGQRFSVYVDYAHTDDALTSTLKTVRELRPRRLIVVFGCGGDRDRTKRPLMGAAAARLADLAILTSDNPRTEDPLAIVGEVEKGILKVTSDRKRYRVIPDRREAIRAALMEADGGDAVLIAGKGHETYQILRDRTIPFDDREVAREILRTRVPANSGHGAH